MFDTGIRAGHPHVKNIADRSDWTHQKSFSDGLGHGSFVAGVISSQFHECPGFAPDVLLHTFKVFTDDQVGWVCCALCMNGECYQQPVPECPGFVPDVLLYTFSRSALSLG